MHQTAILSALSDNPIGLAGDGRCDSPGYNAKYCSYTLMDMKTDLIVDQQLVQVTKAGTSMAMEKMGLERSLSLVLDHGLNVTTLATDRHVGIKCYMKNTYPQIDHQFDVWHLAESITKKLTKKAQSKNCAELLPWVHSISNHLYYCAQSCNGDEELLVERPQSVNQHIVNRHTWKGNLLTGCGYEDLTEEQQNETCWLEIDSPAHEALKDVINDKRLLTDVRKLSQFCHTGSLENYHSVILKYAPKRQHFDYRGMQTRLQLAALDHNHNVGRPVKKDADGNDVTTQSYSKGRECWVVTNVYEKKSYQFRSKLLDKIVQRRLDETVNMYDKSCRVQVKALPRNIAPIPKPSKEDALKGRFTRHLK